MACYCQQKSKTATNYLTYAENVSLSLFIRTTLTRRTRNKNTKKLACKSETRNLILCTSTQTTQTKKLISSHPRIFSPNYQIQIKSPPSSCAQPPENSRGASQGGGWARSRCRPTGLVIFYGDVRAPRKKRTVQIDPGAARFWATRCLLNWVPAWFRRGKGARPGTITVSIFAGDWEVSEELILVGRYIAMWERVDRLNMASGVAREKLHKDGYLTRIGRSEFLDQTI